MSSRGSLPSRLVAAGSAVLLVGVLTACSMPSGGGSPISPTSSAASTAAPTSPASPSSPSGSPVSGEAAAHCRQSGGTVQLRQPTFNTNNDESTWVELGEPVEVCRYQMGEGETSTRIYADLATIYSPRPTLAALAYLAKKPLPSQAADGANPATVDCGALEGTSEFGTSLNGGGLVAEGDPTDVVVNACAFADGSFIEQWGIAYYAAGTIRGKDLKTVFRFDTNQLPPVYS